MTKFSVLCPKSWGLSLIYVLAMLIAAPVAAGAAEDALKFIHQPGGGEIVYGPVAGQATMASAMGLMLKTLHGHFGDRPQVGKFFHTKGSDTVATFFTVTAKNDAGKHIAGLVIVSMPPGSRPSAAVIYDDSQRFSKTANPMMKKLDEVWRVESAKTASGKSGQGTTAPMANANAAPAAALRPTVFPDNSGSIGLPEGWKITFGQQGTLIAAGPNSERFLVGLYIPILDSNNPQQRQMIQMETQGGRVPLPGSYLAVPSGLDPFRTLQAISAQNSAKQHKPPSSIELISKQDLGGNCYHFNLHTDDHDNKGVMFSSITMCIMPPFMPGTYAVTINQIVLPEKLLNQENATLEAMYKSYRTNDAVMNAESRQAIDNIHAIGQRAKIQAEASDAAWKVHQEGHQNQQDSQDRSNQGFSNYLLDQTVVQDSERSERGTLSNGYADALVKADPNRFQYVPTQDYLKGIDY